MALGQTSFIDDGFYPEVHAKGLDFTNIKSDSVKSRMKIGYWKNMLKITITPMGQDANGRWLEIGDEKMITAIDQQKAALLLRELQAFEKGVGGKPSYGIRYTKTIIFITNNNPDKIVHFVIRKFKDDMCTEYDKQAVYEFNTGKHFAIRDCDDFDLSKAQNIPYPQLEFDLLKTILSEYLRAFTGAQVGSMVFYGRDSIYDRANMNLKCIADHLHVTLPKTSMPYSKGDAGKVQAGNNKSSFSNYSKKSVDDANQLIDSCL